MLALSRSCPVEYTAPGHVTSVCDNFGSMRILLLALLATAGAFAQKVSIEFDPAATFAKYRAFSIRDGHVTSVCDNFGSMRILLLALLATAGAFAQKVSIEFDPAATFAKYRTFAIRDGQLNSRN